MGCRPWQDCASTCCNNAQKNADLVVRLVIKLPERRLGLAQQVLGLHENQGLPELAVDLPPQQVEVVCWCRAISHLQAGFVSGRGVG